MSNAYCSQRDFERGPSDEKPEEPSHGVVNQRSAWGNSGQIILAPPSSARENTVQLTERTSFRVESSSSAWGQSWRSSEQEGAMLDECWQEVCQDTQKSETNVAKEALNAAMWEEIRNYGSTRPSLLQNNISMREAMEFNFPDVQYIWHTFVVSLETLPHKETFCTKIKTISRSIKNVGPSEGINSKFLDCELHVKPGATTMQLLEAHYCDPQRETSCSKEGKRNRNPGKYPRTDKHDRKEKPRAISQRCGTRIRDSPGKHWKNLTQAKLSRTLYDNEYTQGFFQKKKTCDAVWRTHEVQGPSVFGLDILVPSTTNANVTVWVTACLGTQLLCKQRGFIVTRTRDETIDTSAETMFSDRAGRNPLPQAGGSPVRSREP